jgi:hypothetical protein
MPRVATTSADDWSPADNPYAIAVSQSQLWREVVHLTILRMEHDDVHRTSWFSSQQLDAHVLIMTLRQLLTAEQLEQVALRELGIDATIRDALSDARTRFEDALPGIKTMRDGLTHFDEWSRGKGWGPQKERVKAGEALRDVAREYWPFGSDPDGGTVVFGPYSIRVDVVEQAADELCQAIYSAAREIDKRNVAARRVRTVEALEGDGLRCGTGGAELQLSPGTDLRIWLSLNLKSESEQQPRELAERVVVVLASTGLHLEPANVAEALEPVERLIRGEALSVESGA